MYFIKNLIFLTFIALISACSLFESEEQPQASEHFTRIYDKSDFSGDFFPTDIIQAADSGFLILGNTIDEDFTFPVTYLLRIDADGNFLWDLVATPYVNPISGSVFREGNDYYFLAMDDISLNTYLISVNDNFRSPELVQEFPYAYPLSVSQVSDGFLLQHYNRNSRSSVMVKLSADFTQEWQREYPVLEDVEEFIIGHLTDPNQRFPFFSGELGNSSYYYMNGFYNFSFSLIFQNPNNEDAFGVVNGFRDKGAISSAVPIQNNQFAISRYSFGENFVAPQVTMNLDGVSFSSDLPGFEIPELMPDAKVVLKKVTLSDPLQTERLIYASTTKSNQVVLFAYDLETGELTGSLYLGQTNPFEIGNLTISSDGGLAITGTTYVVGRFPRICLFKLSENDLHRLSGL